MKNAPVLTLDSHFYTDPTVFESELKGVLARTWQFAGHRSQIPKTGDYFTFEIAGESLFSIRDRDGIVRTYYNVCQHRAHQLLQGTGSAKLIVCPYHAWTYELSGALRSGPNLGNVPGFDRKGICLTEVRTEDFLGFLFVNLDGEADPMDDWFPNVRDELRKFVPQIECLEPLEWIEVSESCNWKVSIENYSECYHCPINHATFAEGVIKPETYNIAADEAGGYVLRHTTECQDLDRMTYPIDLGSNPYAGRYQSWFLWPMFSFQCYPGNVLNTYHWRARDVDHCSVFRGWFTEDGVDNDTVSALAIQDLETTVKEDVRLVESVQRGLRSRGYRPGPLVLDPACGIRSEHSIQILQRWIRESLDPQHQRN